MASLTENQNCRRCGRRLKTPESLAAGMGKICREKSGITVTITVTQKDGTAVSKDIYGKGLGQADIEAKGGVDKWRTKPRLRDSPQLVGAEAKAAKLGVRQRTLDDLMFEELYDMTGNTIEVKSGDAQYDRQKWLMTCLPFSQEKDVILKRVRPDDRTLATERDGEYTIQTNVPWSVIHHSPDGYEWGYGGSGPHDLALNILNLFVPPGSDGFAPVKCYQKQASQTAWSLKGDFCSVFIRTMPVAGGTIPGAEIQAFIDARKSEVRGVTLAEQAEYDRLDALDDAAEAVEAGTATPEQIALVEADQQAIDKRMEAEEEARISETGEPVPV